MIPIRQNEELYSLVNKKVPLSLFRCEFKPVFKSTFDVLSVLAQFYSIHDSNIYPKFTQKDRSTANNSRIVSSLIFFIVSL